MPQGEKAYTGTNKLEHSSEKLVPQGEKAYAGTNKLERSSEKLVPQGEKAYTGTKMQMHILLGGEAN